MSRRGCISAAAAHNRPSTATNPQGVRFLGGNIWPLGAIDVSPDEPWAELQQHWTSGANYWVNTVKFQIDLAHGIGLNAIRLILDVGGIIDGKFTLAQAQANVNQIAGYLQGLGMHFYPCLGGSPHLGSGGTLANQRMNTAILGQTAAQWDCCVGIDLQNEQGGNNADPALLATVRALVPAWIPITQSQVGSYQTAQAGLDFTDMHGVLGLTLPVVKPIIIGEYADAANVGSVNTVMSFHNQVNCTGSFIWDIAQSSSIGIFDQSGNPNTGMVAAMQAGKVTYP